MADAIPILDLEHVAKRYEATGDTEGVEALRDVSLNVSPGESLAVVGPSGSGKTTLLNIIGGLDRPTSGRVSLEGKDLSTLDDAEIALVRNHDIGFVFQAHHLLPQCTAIENVLIPTLVERPGRDKRELAASRARRLLERVGLGGRVSHRPGQLSGGERQRVAVVRALINGPKLLLADEPTGSLDRAASESLAQLLVDLNREEHVTLIVITHAMALASCMDRTLELRDGVLVAHGAGA